MAIEIKRSPVLTGKAAEEFLKNCNKHTTKESKESITIAMSKTKEILSKYKAGK